MTHPYHLYEFIERTLEGADISIADLCRGKVCVFVNVACHCGFTQSNYTDLVALQSKYGSQGLQIVGFPCNQFGGQEPGSSTEIRSYTERFGLNFPLMEKADVKGPNAWPLWAWLTNFVQPTGPVRWNFTKFLFDRSGAPVARFGHDVPAASLEPKIVELLSQPAQ